MNDDEIVYLTWFEFLVLLRVDDFFSAFVCLALILECKLSHFVFVVKCFMIFFLRHRWNVLSN